MSGHIIKDGDLIYVVPLLVDVKKGTARRPFKPIPLDTYSKAPTAAVSFSQNLLDAISRTDKDVPKAVTIAIACPQEEVTTAPRQIIAGLRNTIQNVLKKELELDSKFNISTSKCLASSEENFADAAAVVLSNLKFADNAVQLTSSVRIFKKSSDRSGSYLIQLPPLKGEGDFIIDLPGINAKKVRSLFLSVTNNAGLFPECGKSMDSDRGIDIEELQEAVKNGRLEVSALAAYQILSRDSKNIAASYILGLIFLQKGQFDTAIEYLSKVAENEHNIPEQVRGNLKELIGAAYLGLNEPADAVKYIQEAAKLYKIQGRDNDVSRVLVLQSNALFTGGHAEEAIKLLEENGNLENDGVSLQLLGRLALATGKYKEAINWLSKSLSIKSR